MQHGTRVEETHKLYPLQEKALEIVKQMAYFVWKQTRLRFSNLHLHYCNIEPLMMIFFEPMIMQNLLLHIGFRDVMVSIEKNIF